MAQSIYEEPAVIKRTERRGVLHEITSNGTIAAAVMVGAALLALVVANGPAFEAVEEFLREPLKIGIGTHLIAMSVESFVNDFLMTIFFLSVGIELKYEMTVGQLRRPRQAALPMLAAVGGVCFPALIYLALNWGGQTHGWAVPIATDIAFALGVVSLLGDKISSRPRSSSRPSPSPTTFWPSWSSPCSTASPRTLRGARPRAS